MTIIAVACAYTCANTSRANMCAGLHPMPIEPAACTDRTDVGTGFDATITDAGAGANHGAGMAAGGNAVAIHPSAGPNAADMGSRTYPMLAEMRINANA